MKKLDFKNVKQLTRYGDYTVTCHLKYLDKRIEEYIREDNLNFDVDFQRGHVWNEAQQIAFVEFILRGGKTSPILFNHPGWLTNFSGEMVIVDGKQRCTALIKFINDELPVFGGYTMSQIDNINLNKYSVQLHINNLQTRKEVLEWYLELNGGGTPHTEEELNKVRELLKTE